MNKFNKGEYEAFSKSYSCPAQRFHAIVASKQISEETSMSHKDSAFFAPRFIMVFSILNALC